MAQRERWTQTPFTEELPRLLAERGLSQRKLALAAGVSQSHLSRVLSKARYKTPSRQFAARVALALDLPEDYFIEYREMRVIERVRADPLLRDRLYRRVSEGT